MSNEATGTAVNSAGGGGIRLRQTFTFDGDTLPATSVADLGKLLREYKELVATRTALDRSLKFRLRLDIPTADGLAEPQRIAQLAARRAAAERQAVALGLAAQEVLSAEKVE